MHDGIFYVVTSYMNSYDECFYSIKYSCIEAYLKQTYLDHNFKNFIYIVYQYRKNNPDNIISFGKGQNGVLYAHVKKTT